jgi:hypothetical protein
LYAQSELITELGNASGTCAVAARETGTDVLVGLRPPGSSERTVRWTGPGCPVRLGGGLPLVEREFGRVEAVGRR